MRRPRVQRSARLAAAAAAAVLLAACGGSGAASQDDVQQRVERTLADEGYAGAELTDSQAEAAAQCVAGGLFASDDFSKDDREAVTSAGDGSEPDPELAQRFQTLVDGCVDEVLAVGPAAPDSGDGEG